MLCPRVFVGLPNVCFWPETVIGIRPVPTQNLPHDADVESSLFNMTTYYASLRDGLRAIAKASPSP